MKKITLFLLILSLRGFSQTIQTESTIESIGYTVSNLGSFSSQISVSSKFRVQSGTWRNGYEASISTLNSQRVIFGSFFELTPNTTYDIEITIVDSFPTIHNQVLTATATTMANPVFAFSSDTLWVSPTGSGSTYTHANPGKFDQLFNSNASLIKCGTIICCRGGVYYVGDLQYNAVSTNCGTNLPVTIMSTPGEHAVFDGSDSSAAATYPTWTLYDAATSMYKAVLPPAVSFSTQFMLDTTRLFPYATKYPTALGFGTYYESLSNCNSYFGPGFYHNKDTFYVKLSGGANPTGKKITVSKRHMLLVVYNFSGYNMHFAFRNLEIKNYGRPTINYTGPNITSEYSANAFDLRNLKGTIFDSCKFSFNTISIYMSSRFDSTIIQNCTFKDQTGLWSHGGYKNSSLTEHPDISGLFDDGKFGRVLETMPVWFDANNTSSKVVIIRKNLFDGHVGAIAGRGDANGYNNLVYSTDVYDNTFINNYNIVVPVGNSINFRFFRNTVSRFLVGLSLIDNAVGPVYMFRNVFYDILERDNPANQLTSYNPGTYINYNGCLGLKNKVWASVLKLNAGTAQLPLRYDLHVVHNTMFSTDSLGYNFYLWERQWRNIKCVNNSFNASYCIHNFEAADSNAVYPFISYNDNYYSAGGYVGAVNPSHGNTNCFNDQTLPTFLSDLQNVSFDHDTSLLNITGFTLPPGFVNTSQHDFHLANGSQMIDKGVVVNNISDVLNTNYYGASPDIGAFENTSGGASVKNIFTQTLFLYPNPTSGNFTVYVNERSLGSKLVIRNILGQQIGAMFTLNSVKTELHIDGAPGIYFLELFGEKEKTTVKLVKE